MNKDRTAYPHGEVHDSFGAKGLEFRHLLASTGMTLREHFAGLAMQGMVSSIHTEAGYLRLRSMAAEHGLTVSQWIARDSFKQADAMLAADEQPSELERITAERDTMARAILQWWEDHQAGMGPISGEPEFVAMAIETGVEP